MLTVDRPRITLAQLPTPVQHLPRISATLGREIWIKRDDQTGLALGGNKTRKLELLVADALSAGARVLITGGAAQSNHCRQTAAAAAACGLRCVLVLKGERPFALGGNLLLDTLFGAELIWAEEQPLDDALGACSRQRAEAGLQPYLIPYGGSNGLGAAAYALAAAEVLPQLPDNPLIIVASSSGGTQAGLVAGFSLLGQPLEVYGISVDQPAIELESLVLSLALQAVSMVAAQPPAAGPLTETAVSAASLRAAIRVDDRFLGGGYGVLGDLEREAITLFARQEGILLDPVYTGRAAGAMVRLIRMQQLPSKRPLVFWHTGGVPALWAYSEGLDPSTVQHW